MLWLNYKGF